MNFGFRKIKIFFQIFYAYIKRQKAIKYSLIPKTLSPDFTILQKLFLWMTNCTLQSLFFHFIRGKSRIILFCNN